MNKQHPLFTSIVEDFLIFKFLALFFFSTLNLSFCGPQNKLLQGDFKWESNLADILQMGNNTVI